MLRLTLATILLVATATYAPLQAKTMKECAADWQALKSASATAGQTYTNFSKRCMSATGAASATVPSAAATAPAKKLVDTKSVEKPKATVADKAVKAVPGTPTAVVKQSTTTTSTVALAPKPVVTTDPSLVENQPLPEKPTMAAPVGVTLPKAVSAKYAAEAAGKARLHTCADAYHANKTANALSGLQWIQKGGGFYSLCNASLKG